MERRNAEKVVLYVQLVHDHRKSKVIVYGFIQCKGHLASYMELQWNLRIKDTLSSIESFLEGTMGKGVLCREVVPFSEGPLPEVPL